MSDEFQCGLWQLRRLALCGDVAATAVLADVVAKNQQVAELAATVAGLEAANRQLRNELARAALRSKRQHDHIQLLRCQLDQAKAAATGSRETIYDAAMSAAAASTADDKTAGVDYVISSTTQVIR